ncbi:MAG: hypothetical protein KAJ66_06580 [Candidatus Omnitrophica bacterium]|nr:hypothetical protein [Candidatus Omnitrophota bacterium]
MCDFDTWFLIVLIYIVKFTLVVKRPRPSIAIVLFFCTIMVAVPYIYLRVVDWTETFNVDPLGHWIGTPVMMLFIPVATFIYDLSTKKRIKPKMLALRYIIEIAVFPIWAYFWILLIEGMLLDWWWL